MGRYRMISFMNLTHAHTDNQKKNSRSKHTDMCTCTLSYTRIQIARSDSNTHAHTHSQAHVCARHTRRRVCVRVYTKRNETSHSIITQSDHFSLAICISFAHTSPKQISPKRMRCNRPANDAFAVQMLQFLAAIIIKTVQFYELSI